MDPITYALEADEASEFADPPEHFELVREAA